MENENRAPSSKEGSEYFKPKDFTKGGFVGSSANQKLAEEVFASSGERLITQHEQRTLIQEIKDAEQVKKYTQEWQSDWFIYKEIVPVARVIGARFPIYGYAWFINKGNNNSVSVHEGVAAGLMKTLNLVVASYKDSFIKYGSTWRKS